MTGRIEALRKALVSDLREVHVKVHEEFPGKLNAPCLIVAPPEVGTYVKPGPTFGQSYTVSVDVLIVAGKTAVPDLGALEDLIEKVLLNTQDWALTGVDTPKLLTTNDSVEYLSTVAHISKSIVIE